MLIIDTHTYIDLDTPGLRTQFNLKICFSQKYERLENLTFHILCGLASKAGSETAMGPVGIKRRVADWHVRLRN